MEPEGGRRRNGGRMLENPGEKNEYTSKGNENR